MVRPPIAAVAPVAEVENATPTFGLRLAYRLTQGLRALFPSIPAERDAILATALSPAQAAAFRALSAHDQAHLCRVYQALVAQTDADDDLLVAALLHDVAKVSSRGRVRLHDRVARVVLRLLSPRILECLARLPASRWRSGIVLAVHHPRLGAERARQLGCSVRTCWLIAHHEDAPLPDDADLRRLVRADHAAG